MSRLRMKRDESRAERARISKLREAALMVTSGLATIRPERRAKGSLIRARLNSNLYNSPNYEIKIEALVWRCACLDLESLLLFSCCSG